MHCQMLAGPFLRGENGELSHKEKIISTFVLYHHTRLRQMLLYNLNNTYAKEFDE